MSGGGGKMALTATQINQAKPRESRYNLKDENGLYLEVSPTGKKLWRVRYWLDGKENRIGIGPYPHVGLAEARKRCLEIKGQIADKIDPVQKRREEKTEQQVVESSVFSKVAMSWLATKKDSWSPGHAETVLQRLEANIFPLLGDTPIKTITAPQMLEVLRQIEKRGALEVARRVRGICSQIFRYGIACGLADQDPAAPLVGALKSPPKQHYASIIDPKQVGQLLRDIDKYQGSQVVYCAFRLSPLLFVRPGELRQAEWSEIDLEAAEWRIPKEKMKMRKPHIVPLSRQALEIFQALKPLTGHGQYVFPAMTTSKRPMSDNTINMALRRIGYDKEQMTAHGFRSMASTLLNEQGYHPDAIERQLAHSEKNHVRAAYNYAEYLPERRKMMQDWADYLDSLRQEAV